MLFPLAAQSLGALFSEITLPTVSGLTVSSRRGLQRELCGDLLNLN
jgi:hypothetical protein